MVIAFDNDKKKRCTVLPLTRALRTGFGLGFVILVLLSQGIGIADSSSHYMLATGSSLSTQKKAEEVENQIKAAFVYNFMKFTEWSSEKKDSEGNHQFTNSNGNKPPMVIGIVGENPFGKAFEPLMKKTIKDRPLKIIEFPTLSDYRKEHPDISVAFQHYFQDHLATLRSVHVLFFCKSEQEVLLQFLNAIEGAGVLTISDINNFARTGGIIGFIKEKKKIRFEINLTEAENQKLKISSQLLKLAKEVIREKKKK